ncbi:hypothetical protein [Flintibacter sp. KGMB00164]|nr:hypothetical protein [Flintibacter sp. KGMB00164]
MKNRTDRMLLRIFLVSLLACAVYGIHRLWKKRISQPQGNSHSVL